MADSNLEKCIENVLKKFVFDIKLKPEQRQVISLICNGKDALGVLPTGFGKSLTYTLIPLLMDEVIKKNPKFFIFWLFFQLFNILIIIIQVVVLNLFKYEITNNNFC